MSAKIEATIEDLYRMPENGKAEIIDGELNLCCRSQKRG